MRRLNNAPTIIPFWFAKAAEPRATVAMSKVAPLFVAPAAAACMAASDVAKDDSEKTVEHLNKENADLRRNNIALQINKEGLQSEITTLKRKLTENAEQSPTKKPKTATQVKKLFDKWNKALRRQSAKSKLSDPSHRDHYSVVVKEGTAWSMADFLSVFDNKGGTKIQPTPENKPTSAMTILAFPNAESIKSLFGSELDVHDYMIQIFRQRSFCKVYKLCDEPAELMNLHVNYNKSKRTLELHFGLELDNEDYY